MVANSEGVTAELYKAIVAIVDDRVKEIRVTREDFSELRRAVNELAEAQIRTEKRVEEVFKVMFGFFIHPSATELAEREEIVLVASYQR